MRGEETAHTPDYGMISAQLHPIFGWAKLHRQFDPRIARQACFQHPRGFIMYTDALGEQIDGGDIARFIGHGNGFR